MISRTSEPEVRLQDYWFNSPEFLGTDVTELKPGQVAVIDGQTLGYPFRSFTEIPAGDYYVQASLIGYREYRRADGHVVWAVDQWNGHRFNASSGTLYSSMQQVRLDSSSNFTVRVNLTKVVPPSQAPKDSEWVKYIKIQSRLLTQFWGRPMYLGAVVLLPRDYASQPTARYPVIYQQQAHFSAEPPFGFSTEDLSEQDDDRLIRTSRGLETGYAFYQAWASDAFPRVIAVSLQHPTPYADFSATLNSANNGPYGDAIAQELIPYIEKQFRIIREPYARVLLGKSLGGRDALAQQLLYPAFFGGAWIFYPWGIDPQRYASVNLYSDSNAFGIDTPESPFWKGLWSGTQWSPLERYLARTLDGQPLATMRQLSHHDAVLAPKWGGEFGAENAIFGPIDEDASPRPLWDWSTGEIDRDVAQYWREHGDLLDYAQKNWPRIGPDLVGKLHFYVGDMDEFYRNRGVRHFEEFLRNTTDPNYGGSFDYAPLQGHGWQPMTDAALVRIMADHIARTAPKGASALQ